MRVSLDDGDTCGAIASSTLATLVRIAKLLALRTRVEGALDFLLGSEGIRRRELRVNVRNIGFDGGLGLAQVLSRRGH